MHSDYFDVTNQSSLENNSAKNYYYRIMMRVNVAQCEQDQRQTIQLIHCAVIY